VDSAVVRNQPCNHGAQTHYMRQIDESTTAGKRELLYFLTYDCC
jgi:hypothetical protein